LDELHDDVNKVVDDATTGLDDLAGIAVLIHFDDTSVLEVLKDGDLVVDREDGVLVTAQELFLEDFDGRVVLGVDLLAEVDLTGVALAEGLDDLIFPIEDWVESLGCCVCLSLHLVYFDVKIF